MADGEEMDPRALDRFEQGVRLVHRAWLAFVLVGWLSWSWTSGGDDHLVQPFAILLSPVLVLGIDQVRRSTPEPARGAFETAELAAIAMAVADPVLGVLRGTIASAGLAFVALPFYAAAMRRWADHNGPRGQVAARWAQAQVWSAALAVAVLLGWAALIGRGVVTGHWNDVDVSGVGPVFGLIVTLGLLLPASLITAGLGAWHTRRWLKLRPLRGID